MIEEFLGIVIVGAIVSVLFQFIKTYFKSSLSKKAAIVGASLIVGGVYVWLRATPYWETVLTILISSSAVYTLLIKKD